MKLDNFEIEFLKRLQNLGYKYIARDLDNTINTFYEEPEKQRNCWFTKGLYMELYEEMFLNLQFIKWTDKNPVLIADLLKNNYIK